MVAEEKPVEKALEELTEPMVIPAAGTYMVAPGGFRLIGPARNDTEPGIREDEHGFG